MNSYWIESTKENLKEYKSLTEDKKADVCVIGAGITGITTAYKLAKEGYHVIVLEKDDVCTHTTGNTTGKITSAHGLFYKYLLDSYSSKFAKRYFDANQEAIEDIEEIIKREQIDCDFERKDNYIFTKDPNEVEKIKDEVKIMNQIGAKVSFVEKSSLPISILAGVKLENQAQFHPRKYSMGLSEKIKKMNGEIFANTKVEDIKHENNQYITYTKDHNITSKYVVIATHYPIKDFPGFYFLKMYQEKSYIIGVETNQNLFDGMFINVEKPSLSFRTAKDKGKDILLIGGSNHKVGQNENIENSYLFLEQEAKRIYSDAKIVYRWSTQDCISLDKIPYIGKFSSLMPNIYVATGYKKWGMTTSNIAANIIKDKIMKNENQYEEIFSSTRFEPLKNHKEVTNMITQTSKSLLFDKLKIPKETIEDVKEQEGKIITIEGKKVGIYKKEGKEYIINPICSHLGCELSFNNLEKTWDCPCHGSRFDYTGKSINDPSTNHLEVY